MVTPSDTPTNGSKVVKRERSKMKPKRCSSQIIISRWRWREQWMTFDDPCVSQRSSHATWHFARRRYRIGPLAFSGTPLRHAINGRVHRKPSRSRGEGRRHKTNVVRSGPLVTASFKLKAETMAEVCLQLSCHSPSFAGVSQPTLNTFTMSPPFPSRPGQDRAGKHRLRSHPALKTWFSSHGRNLRIFRGFD